MNCIAMHKHLHNTICIVKSMRSLHSGCSIKVSIFCTFFRFHLTAECERGTNNNSRWVLHQSSKIYRTICTRIARYDSQRVEISQQGILKCTRE